ncbi:hypothetical protein DBT47_09675, partial [Aerococcus mictus]
MFFGHQVAKFAATDQGDALVLQVPANRSRRQKLVVGNARAPVGADGAEFGRVESRVKDHIADLAGRDLVHHVARAGRAVVLDRKRKLENAVEHGDAAGLQLFDRIGQNGGRLAVISTLAPLILAEAQTEG